MKKPWILLLCAVAVLAACGGGGDDSPPAATAQVPASASASPSGFISYLKLLVASMADTLEPVDVSAVTPPADDTGSPASVD
jgi:Prokaryotic membrane lipoprotein lipid attachment site